MDSVIVIADADVPSAQAWSDGSGHCWLDTTLPKLLQGYELFEFRYGAELSKSFSWQLILDYGDGLLEELIKLSAQARVDQMPGLFYDLC